MLRRLRREGPPVPCDGEHQSQHVTADRHHRRHLPTAIALQHRLEGRPVEPVAPHRPDPSMNAWRRSSGRPLERWAFPCGCRWSPRPDSSPPAVGSAARTYACGSPMEPRKSAAETGATPGMESRQGASGIPHDLHHLPFQAFDVIVVDSELLQEEADLLLQAGEGARRASVVGCGPEPLVRLLAEVVAARLAQHLHHLPLGCRDELLRSREGAQQRHRGGLQDGGLKMVSNSGKTICSRTSAARRPVAQQGEPLAGLTR